MKTKSKKALDSFQKFELKKQELKHLKGGIVIEDEVNA